MIHTSDIIKESLNRHTNKPDMVTMADGIKIPDNDSDIRGTDEDEEIKDDECRGDVAVDEQAQSSTNNEAWPSGVQMKTKW